MWLMRSLWMTLSTGADGRWQPGIGDPTPMGWLTVIAYAAAAGAAFWVAHTARTRRRELAMVRARERSQLASIARFWLIVCCVMGLLGINKQLDLQSLITQVGRDLSMAQGWYEDRRPLQLAFVAIVMVVGSVATLSLAYSVRHVIGRVAGGVVGLGMIVSFVVIRAASFHHIDLLLRGPLHLNWVLELSAIGVVLVSALRAARRERSAGIESSPALEARARRIA
jgi:hypothetical protein